MHAKLARHWASHTPWTGLIVQGAYTIKVPHISDENGLRMANMLEHETAEICGIHTWKRRGQSLVGVDIFILWRSAPRSGILAD